MEFNKKFHIRGNLVKHVKAVHLKMAKKHKCNICDVKLTSKASLNNHILVKHGEEQDLKLRRVKCDICFQGKFAISHEKTT